MESKVSLVPISALSRLVRIFLLIAIGPLCTSCERSQEMSTGFANGYFLLSSHPFVFRDNFLTDAPDSVLERFQFRADDAAFDSIQQNLYFDADSLLPSGLSVPPDGDSYIFRYDLSKSNSEPILFTKGYKPRPSQNGKRLAFVRNGTEIWTRDILTGDERRLVADLRHSVAPFSWLSTHRILYMNTPGDLMIADLDSGQIKATRHTNIWPVAPFPDGSKVICVEEKGGGILEYDPGTNEFRKIFQGKSPGLALVWAPDSSGFFMTSRHSMRLWQVFRDTPNLHFFRLDGRSVRIREWGYLDGGAFLRKDMFLAKEPL